MFEATTAPKRTIANEMELTERYIDMLEARLIRNAVDKKRAEYDISMLRSSLNELFVLQSMHNAGQR